jgi:DNA mismatch endonuclease (patch repair protein)
MQAKRFPQSRRQRQAAPPDPPGAQREVYGGELVNRRRSGTEAIPCIPESQSRSHIMSGIRSRGNRTTELAVATIFRVHRIRGWRRHLSLPGCPDFAFPAVRLVVFVDGCFWHGCPWCYKAPKHNNEYWAAKLDRNRARDLLVSRKLRSDGWSVCRIWEHAVAEPERVAQRVRRMIEKASLQ